MTLTKARADFLEELAYENPEPAEAWKLRDNWDPPFALSVIDAAAKAGLIETRGDRRSSDFAYRFTSAGRRALAEHVAPTPPTVNSGDGTK